jgi:hypothetical protein
MNTAKKEEAGLHGRPSDLCPWSREGCTRKVLKPLAFPTNAQGIWLGKLISASELIGIPCAAGRNTNSVSAENWAEAPWGVHREHHGHLSSIQRKGHPAVTGPFYLLSLYTPFSAYVF